MGPPPPVDHGLDHWNPPSVLNAELDGLMSPSPGYSTRFQDRTAYHEPSHILGDSQPHIQLPSMRPMNPDPRPLVRYTQDTTGGPWNSQQVSGPSPMDLASPRGYIPHSPAHPSFSYPRSSPRSDGGSSNNSRRPHDSGYVSRTVISNPSPGFENQSQGSHSITGPMTTMDIDHHSYGTESIYAPEEPYPPIENGPNFPLKCNVEDCQHVSKNHSEYKSVIS